MTSPGLADHLEALQARDDSERAVEHSALGHRVDVGPRQDRRVVTGQGRRAEATEGVASRVHPGCQTRLAHLGEQPRPGLLVLWAPGRAGDTAARQPAEAGKRDKTTLKPLQRYGKHGGAEYNP